jgi:hypothetical protein
VWSWPREEGEALEKVYTASALEELLARATHKCLRHQHRYVTVRLLLHSLAEAEAGPAGPESWLAYWTCFIAEDVLACGFIMETAEDVLACGFIMET